MVQRTRRGSRESEYAPDQGGREAEKDKATERLMLPSGGHVFDPIAIAPVVTRNLAYLLIAAVQGEGLVRELSIYEAR